MFYDIDARGPFFSLLGATLVGPGENVVSFEPHPKTAGHWSDKLKSRLSVVLRDLVQRRLDLAWSVGAIGIRVCSVRACFCGDRIRGRILAFRDR